MAAITRGAARVYASDSAFVAGLLLAVGLLGSTAGLWLQLAA